MVWHDPSDWDDTLTGIDGAFLDLASTLPASAINGIIANLLWLHANRGGNVDLSAYRTSAAQDAIDALINSKLTFAAVGISPNRIDAVADLDGDYVLYLAPLSAMPDEANEVEIWIGSESVHTVAPYDRSTQAIPFTIDTSEETQIGLAADAAFALVRAVFRHRDGGSTYLAEAATLLRIGPDSSGLSDRITTNAQNITQLETDDNNLRLALASLTEALPDGVVPEHASEAKRYELRLPANQGRATWEEAQTGGGGGGGAIADNSIAPVKAQADTAAQQKAWRARLGSASIIAGASLPATTEVNLGDVHIFPQAVADGLNWVDISDQGTVITSAESGDVGLFLARGWVRVGNILAGIAARANAAEALANTRRLRPVSVWERTEVARTIYLEWQPRVAVALNAQLAITIGGTPNNRANPEAVAAGSDSGVLLPIPISAVNAANITRSSGAIAGWVEIQITFGGVTDTTWMRAVPAPSDPGYTFTRVANEAALPANVPANTVAWYPEA